MNKLQKLLLSVTMLGSTWFESHAAANVSGVSQYEVDYYKRKRAENVKEQREANMAKVYDRFIASFATQEKAEELAKQAKRTDPNYDPNHPEIELMGPVETIKTLKKYLDVDGKATAIRENVASVAHNIYSDLGLFNNPDKPEQVSVFSYFAENTATSGGKWAILNRMLNPKKDIESLRELQKGLEFLVHEDDVYTKLDSTLKNIGKFEPLFTAFVKEYVSGNSRSDFKRYMDEKVSTSSSEGMSSLYWNASLFGRGTCPVLLGALGAYLVWAEHSNLIGRPSYLDRPSSVVKIKGTNNNVIPIGVEYKKILGYGALAACIFGTKYTWKNWYCSRKEMGDRIVEIADSLRSYFDNIIDLATMVNQNNTLATIFLEHRHTIDLICGKEAGIVKDVIDALHVTSIGGKFKAVAKMYESIDTLKGVFNFVSEVDATLAVAGIVRKTTKDRLAVTIAHPVKSPDGRPYVSITDAYHPSLPSNTNVTNNIQIGGNNPIHQLIEGGNAGGKSIYIYIIGLDCIVAQTLGVVFGHDAEYTPFAHFVASTTAESKVGEQSMLENELTKLIAGLEMASTLKPDEFALDIKDEPLKGGNYEICSEKLYQILVTISKYLNVAIIVASHFLRLNELEKSGWGIYKVDSRYYQCAEYPDKDYYLCTYKIIPGKNKETKCVDFMMDKKMQELGLQLSTATTASTAITATE